MINIRVNIKDYFLALNFSLNDGGGIKKNINMGGIYGICRRNKVQDNNSTG